METVAHESVLGRTLGDFIVREEIGRGGFGAVYRAEQPLLNREAVVKIMHGGENAAPEEIERFLREVRLASRLDHPFAAHIYAFGVEMDGLRWIAMELVRGVPLASMIEERGRIELGRFVPLLDRICEVLHTAHEQGIIHRDIKPANVMVMSRAGRLSPKLLDFGIAKLLDTGAGQAAPSLPLVTDEQLRQLEDSSRSVTPQAVMATVAAQPLAIANTSPSADRLTPRVRNVIDAVAAAQRTPLLPAESGPSVDTTPGPNVDTTPAPSGDGTPSGSAPARGGSGERALTRKGAVMGSPHFMAPEQWVNAGEVDARTDIYALGVLAYQAISGRLPFEASTVVGVARAHMTQKVPPLPEGMPRELEAVLKKAMAKKPAARYANALHFAAAFREAAGIGGEQETLTPLDESVRDTAIADFPQPIAESVAALVAAHNAHQAREALWEAFRATVRYLGILTLASRSRAGASGERDGGVVKAALRQLHKRGLDDGEWIELMRELLRPYAQMRDLHPVPEMVALFFAADGSPGPQSAQLDALLELRARSGSVDIHELLQLAVPALAALLRGLAFLADYAVVARRGDVVERWMGTRRAWRTVVHVLTRPIPERQPTLIDASCTPILQLWPLMQIDEPSPGAEPELFMLEGPGRVGARLVSLPSRVERQSETLWNWFGAELLDVERGTPAAAAEERSPYRGLSPFSSEDAALFFGREREVDSFVNRLRTQPLLAVVGPSGAGKSSFVQAGVVPRLPSGWRVLTARPGAAPVSTLQARLGRDEITWDGQPATLGDVLRAEAERRGETIVLIVDQLEELVTMCHDEAERERFAAALARAASSTELPVRVLLTLRDDFLIRLEQIADFHGRLAPALHLLTTPAAKDLLRILVEPATRSGYEFEDKRLPEAMVAAVANQVGALPLLSFTAARLWEFRDRHFKQLPRKAYEAMGGVAGALAQHAESVLESMSLNEQRLVREAFRHLVTSEGTRAALTRPEMLQLLGGEGQVIEKLVEARLLVSFEAENHVERIEVVHEALLNAWPRLSRWRQEDAEGARLRDQLRAAARQWHERGRPKGLLWRAEALTEYELWRRRHPRALTDVEEAFASASVADAARSRRLRRLGLLATLIGLVSFSLVLLGMNSRAIHQRALAQEASAEAQRRLADSYEEQGRQFIVEGDMMRGLAFLREAYRVGARGAGLQFLFTRALMPLDKELASLSGHGDRVFHATFSPDGKRVATMSQDGSARVWDVVGGRLLFTLAGHQSVVFTGEFSADGKRIVTAAFDGTAKVWDATDGKLLFTLAGHTSLLYAARFSPTEPRIVTASEDATARVWDATSGKALFTLAGHTAPVTSAAFSPDGTRIATASRDGLCKLWDAHSGRLVATLAGHSDTVQSVAFSPSGTRLLTASWDKTARLWSLPDGKSIAILHHMDTVWGGAFDPRGRTVVTASFDRSAKVWDAATGSAIVSLEGHSGAIYSANYSSDGNRIVTASYDGTAKVWDARSGRLWSTLVGHLDSLWWGEFSPAGDRIVTASLDHTAKIWNPTPSPLLFSIDVAPSELVWFGTYSPDAARIASLSTDGIARIWDATSGRLVAAWRERPHALASEKPQLVITRVTAAFDPTGRRLVTVNHNVAEVWDIATQKRTLVLSGHGDTVQSAVFSPDGTRILTASVDKTAKLWDAATGALILTFTGHEDELPSAAFSPDGRHVVTASGDRTARIWSTATGRLERTLTGHLDAVWSARYSPDGRRLVTSSGDHTARIWDAETGEQWATLEAHKGDVVSASFSPDGVYVVTAGLMDGSAKLWEVARGRLLASYDVHAGWLNWAEFSPRGDRILTAGADGTIKVIDVHTDARPVERIFADVDCRVPFRIVQGRLASATPSCAPPAAR